MNLRRLNLMSAVEPQWKNDRRPDPSHFYRRTLTKRYQAKKKILYYMWLAVLSTVIVNPYIQYAVGVGLLMTFFSFFILDEIE